MAGISVRCHTHNAPGPNRRCVYPQHRSTPRRVSRHVDDPHAIAIGASGKLTAVELELRCQRVKDTAGYCFLV